jgi:hypothetical protein
MVTRSKLIDPCRLATAISSVKGCSAYVKSGARKVLGEDEFPVVILRTEGMVDLEADIWSDMVVVRGTVGLIWRLATLDARR